MIRALFLVIAVTFADACGATPTAPRHAYPRTQTDSGFTLVPAPVGITYTSRFLYNP